MKALIIGGGIAGPVAAMALQQAGIDPVIYEAYKESAGLEAGSFLSVAVNGIDALRAIDLHQEVMAAGFPSETITMRSGAGKVLGVVPIGGRLADGTVTHTLKRADLYRVVREAAIARGIPIELGKQLVSASSNDSGVIATFADGSSAVGDLLIGADGIHSRTRAQIDPDAVKPHYTGIGNIGGFTSASAVSSSIAGTYEMIFGKKAFFGYTVAPSGEIWWFANPPSKQAIQRDTLRRMTSDDWKARLIDLFGEDRSPAAEIIAATSEPIAGFNAFDLPKVERWRRDRMLIVGDAAHAASPSSGQGASMAIEDAIVLAVCLRDRPDPAAAFATYEQLRRERVERVVAFGARNSSAKTVGPIGRVIRDAMMPFFLKRLAGQSERSLSWLYDYHIAWNRPVGAIPVAVA